MTDAPVIAPPQDQYAQSKTGDAPAITLPQDHYAHPDAATEWWWHIGTLNSGDRVFGFEIAINGSGAQGSVFTQLMLTDVQNQQHYQATSGTSYSKDWAESDATKPWYAVINGPDGAGCQTGFATNPLNMSVQASFTDIDTAAEIILQLQLNQKGAPLLVWGTGLQDGNYYYSLTNLQASGQISINGEIFPVTGVTWMDHEWGVFPPGTAWILQDMQLPNGIAIMNYAAGIKPELGKPMPSHATILDLAGGSTEHDSTSTPLGPTWTDRHGNEYFTRWTVEIPGITGTNFEVTSLVPGQAFEQAISVYEGVATFTGQLAGEPVSGTAWNEQKLAG